MTFQRQVWWSRVIGMVALIFGGVFVVIASQTSLAVGGAKLLTTAAGYLLGIGFVLLIFGGIIRPIQRWLVLNTLMPSTLYSQDQKRRALMWPMRRFWHVDAEGRDLDAITDGGPRNG